MQKRVKTLCVSLFLCFSVGFDQLYLQSHSSLVQQARATSESPRPQGLCFPGGRSSSRGFAGAESFAAFPHPGPMQSSSNRRGRAKISKAEVLFCPLIMRLDTGSLAYFCTQRNLIGFIIAAFAYISVTADTEQS